MDHDGVGEGGAQPGGGLLTAVGFTAVDDPEDPLCGGVGILGHDLGDQVRERRDAGLRLAAAEHLGVADAELHKAPAGWGLSEPEGDGGRGLFLVAAVADRRAGGRSGSIRGNGGSAELSVKAVPV
ncbi:hypothetical protein AB0I68_31120 [Streptomyces sp. NPDC050448]|uniref:hypothetical protein n=1 Tax=Streptomyces sp. NPDC050448 TaxID=3155404 RepID=UPI00343D637C